LLLWVYFLHFSSLAKAQESTKQSFRVQAGLDLIYDDNVWQYSDSDRERFENNPDDPFFQKTNTLDDLIWEPYLFLNLQPFNRTPSTRLLADLTGDFYTQNTALNFGTYRIGLEQGIGDKTHALITYTLTPRIFVGMSRERRGGVVLGETMTTHVTRFRIERELQDLDLGLTAHYKFRNYNDAFNEQDSDIYGIGLFTRIYSAHGLKTRLEYLFEQGLAAGRNTRDVCVTINNSTICPNDLSYLSNQFVINPEIQINRTLSIAIKYELKYKQFTTNLTNDSNHYNRKDFTHTPGLNVYYEISKSTEAKLGFERVMRRVNNNSDFFSYDENIATVGLSYLF
jgi:hypothetical protein